MQLLVVMQKQPIQFIFISIITLILSLANGCGGGSGAGDGSSNSNAGTNPTVQPSRYLTEGAAIRFLEQSSFGPSSESIARLRELGYQGFIDEQFTLSHSNYEAEPDAIKVELMKERFISNAINQPDQLRQRMAYALSQIFVVSSLGVPNRFAIQSYHQYLLDNAFANYFDLLKGITLHPTMGRFLDMVNNSVITTPNENYARELMQLFSIGMHQLNPDGAVLRDINGEPIPAYTQQDVEALSRALTGWTYPTKPGKPKYDANPHYYYGPMESSPTHHDYGEKTILGRHLPAGQSPEQDLNDAISVIFEHPNVGPFISFRLIQHFVTSNPSSEYIRRVAHVFNDNGQGIRGDLRAVITAVLLDPEARFGDLAESISPGSSRLKEPVLFGTNVLRSVGARSSGKNIPWLISLMGQDIFSAPSVFNYYPPDHRIGTGDMYGPEFKILTSPEISERFNFVHRMINTTPPAGTIVNLEHWIQAAEDTDAFVEALNMRFLHGTMSSSMKEVLTARVDSMPKQNYSLRAQMGLYLVLTSTQFSIHH